MESQAAGARVIRAHTIMDSLAASPRRLLTATEVKMWQAAVMHGHPQGTEIWLAVGRQRLELKPEYVGNHPAYVVSSMQMLGCGESLLPNQQSNWEFIRLWSSLTESLGELVRLFASRLAVEFRTRTGRPGVWMHYDACQPGSIYLCSLAWLLSILDVLSSMLSLQMTCQIGLASFLLLFPKTFEVFPGSGTCGFGRSCMHEGMGHFVRRFLVHALTTSCL